jgi:hypothetical protein
MHIVAALWVTVPWVGCGGNAMSGSPAAADASAGAAGAAGGGSGGASASDGAAPADSGGSGPCDPFGTWSIGYELGPQSPEACGLPPGDKLTIAKADGGAGATADYHGAPSTFELSADGCGVHAVSSWSGTAGGEPQGESWNLRLTLAGDTGTGTLEYSKWWWCGMHGQGTFVAKAKRP